MSLSKSQADKVQRALANHERYHNSYFWQPPGSASGRRAQEKRDSWTVRFRRQGVHYEYQSRVSCSARNVYYRGRFFVNGEQKTVRAFKALTAPPK